VQPPVATLSTLEGVTPRVEGPPSTSQQQVQCDAPRIGWESGKYVVSAGDWDDDA
jgi:hypothetical protein